jgi:hypothetical protein
MIRQTERMIPGVAVLVEIAVEVRQVRSSYFSSRT